jgi:hypothetical protein
MQFQINKDYLSIPFFFFLVLVRLYHDSVPKPMLIIHHRVWKVYLQTPNEKNGHKICFNLALQLLFETRFYPTNAEHGTCSKACCPSCEVVVSISKRGENGTDSRSFRKIIKYHISRNPFSGSRVPPHTHTWRNRLNELNTRSAGLRKRPARLNIHIQVSTQIFQTRSL